MTKTKLFNKIPLKWTVILFMRLQHLKACNSMVEFLILSNIWSIYCLFSFFQLNFYLYSFFSICIFIFIFTKGFNNMSKYK
uniref:Uncharacterized protein n=1 Tax=Anguilla anguilla TaxID=7936 RepID=A0A0E9X1J4_ANGAN